VHEKNRVVWTEGMFLGPQHFQQQDRFVLSSIANVNDCSGPFPYGFTSLVLDTSALSQGKLALTSATGIFPDGTPFKLPAEGDLPTPLDISTGTRDQIVSLAIPFNQQSSKDISESISEESFSRYLLHDQSITDRHSIDSSESETVFTASLWTRLIVESNDDMAYHTLPIARIRERREDGTVELDAQFNCCALSVAASVGLQSNCRDLYGLLVQRSADLSAKIGSPSASDSSQLAHLMLLLLINRARPLVKHFIDIAEIHPELLFRELIKLNGELATITHKERTSPDTQSYLHRDQFASFDPLIRELRESLNWIPDSTTESFPVQHVTAGIYTATVTDPVVFTNSRFILAVKSSTTPDELMRRFPSQTTIASKNQLRELVSAQSNGVDLMTLANVPPSIPAYERYVYFELNRDSALWREISVSSIIALHIAGTNPDLEMILWTVQA